MTPEIRAFLQEPVAADRHQGQREIARPPARPSRLCRRQAVLAGGAACRANCASSGCSRRAPTRARHRDPLHRHKVAQVMRRAGLRSRRAIPAARCSTCWRTIRATSCSRSMSTRCCPSPTDILSLDERPRVRALARIDQFDRFVSVLVFIPKDRYDSMCARGSASSWRRLYKGRFSAAYPAYPEGPLARTHFIIGRDERRDADSRPRDAGGGGQRRRAHLERRAARGAGRTTDRRPRTRCWRRATPGRSRAPTARRSPEPTRSPTSACSSGSTTIIRAPCASTPRWRRGEPRVDADGVQPRAAHAPLRARAGAGEPRLQGRQRAHLPRRVDGVRHADGLPARHGTRARRGRRRSSSTSRSARSRRR